MTYLRAFDLWAVPFGGGATLGWPGAPYAPDRGDVEVVPHDLIVTTDATSKAVAGTVRAGRVPATLAAYVVYSFTVHGATRA